MLKQPLGTHYHASLSNLPFYLVNALNLFTRVERAGLLVAEREALENSLPNQVGQMYRSIDQCASRILISSTVITLVFCNFFQLHW